MNKDSFNFHLSMAAIKATGEVRKLLFRKFGSAAPEFDEIRPLIEVEMFREFSPEDVPAKETP